MTETVFDRIRQPPLVRYVIVFLVGALLALAAGHQYLLADWTTLYLGLPAWLWAQLGVIGVMFVIAWLAVGLYAGATEGG